MALDPLIANPATVKIADPLEQYGNFLHARYLQSEIGKANLANKQNALIAQAYQDPSAFKPDGSPDFNAVARKAAALGAGPAVSGIAMDAAKAASDQAMAFKNQQEGVSAQANAVGKTFETFHSRLGSLPDDPAEGVKQFVNLSAQFHQDPVIAGLLQRSNTTPAASFQQSIREAQQAAQGGPLAWRQWKIAQQEGTAKAYEQVVTPQNTGGVQRLVQHSPYGGPATTVPGSLVANSLSPDQAANLDPNVIAAKAGATNLTAAAIKDFADQHKQVQQIPQSIQHIDDALSLIDKSSAITGLAQGQQLDIQRALRLFNITPSGDKTADTQLLNKKLNEFVLDQFKSGNTGRTTNMLLKLTQDANANGTMDPAAIKAVLLSKRSDLQRQVDIHNNLANQLLNSNIGGAMSGLGYGPVSQIAPYGIPPAAIQALRAHPDKAADFDAKYQQPGAAQRILGVAGGTATAGSPFPPALNGGAP